MTASVRASYKLTGWNAPQLKLRVANIMTAYGKAMDQQLKEEIQLVQFSWPGSTYRKNGTIEGSPRDIVDTGAFLASQRRNRLNATTIQFTWGSSGGVNYAGYILRGVPGKAYPGRDWIKPALDNLPLDRFFRAEWSRLAGRAL
jgi:hypothetical protein